MRTLHKAKLEQTEDGRWRAEIETLPECEVVADTQGEALVALTVERKLRAIAEAAKHGFPTADIEDLYR